MRGLLCLEDGFTMEGTLVGEGQAVGDVVFVTGMTGYENVLRDPTYAGKILVFTFPMIGNYGLTPGPSPMWPEGIVTKDLWPGPVDPRRVPLPGALPCPALTGIDTRRLTLHIRDGGAKKGAIVPIPALGASPDLIAASVALVQSFCPSGLTSRVAPTKISVIPPSGEYAGDAVLLDFGTKESVKRLIGEVGLRLTVVPPATSSREILGMSPRMVLVSGGPMDPSVWIGAVRTTKELLGQVPVLGIGLGHLALAQAVGAEIVRLGQGRHGEGRPVRETSSGRILMTVQNHTYVVDEDTLPKDREITHRSLTDGIVMGLLFRELGARSIQFDPEGLPDPLAWIGIKAQEAPNRCQNFMG